MNQRDQDKIKRYVTNICVGRTTAEARIERISQYVVGLLVSKQAFAGMIAILVGGFCLMLGLYIGLHIPR